MTIPRPGAVLGVLAECVGVDRAGRQLPLLALEAFVLGRWGLTALPQHLDLPVPWVLGTWATSAGLSVP